MRRTTKITAALSALAITAAACVPPAPPPPPAQSTGVDGVMGPHTYQPAPGVVPCEAFLNYSVTLIEDYAAQVVGHMTYFGGCPPPAWSLVTWIVCTRGGAECGRVTVPDATQPAAVTLFFTVVPDFAVLTLFQAVSIGGEAGTITKTLPPIHCHPDNNQCYFQLPSPN